MIIGLNQYRKCDGRWEEREEGWEESIEEGMKQETRQNVVVLDWGSSSNAALGNFGVKV